MRVWPKNEEIRKFIAHPVAGPFREVGPAEWPDDSFTYRRVVDGDVLTEDPDAKDAKETKAKSATKTNEGDK